MMGNITCFKFKGLITRLNDLGFTHSSGNTYNDGEFKNGRGFIIDLDDKTYSYALVYDDKVKTKDEILEILTNYFNGLTYRKWNIDYIIRKFYYKIKKYEK